jgi:hypothetical protein
MVRAARREPSPWILCKLDLFLEKPKHFALQQNLRNELN